MGRHSGHCGMFVCLASVHKRPLSGVGTVSVSRHCQMFPVVRVGGGGENCPGWRTTIETTTAQLVNLPTMQETQRCRFDHWVRKIPWRRA